MAKMNLIGTSKKEREVGNNWIYIAHPRAHTRAIKVPLNQLECATELDVERKFRSLGEATSASRLRVRASRRRTICQNDEGPCATQCVKGFVRTDGEGVGGGASAKGREPITERGSRIEPPGINYARTRVRSSELEIILIGLVNAAAAGPCPPAPEATRNEKLIY
jgi:hypothetical protein